MKIAISNIAWDISEDFEVCKLLQSLGVNMIDVAPSKYFPNMDRVTEKDIKRTKAAWEEQGIKIYGMQSLLFGTNDLNLFGPDYVQSAMLDHLGKVCDIGAGLGAKRLAFGSPRNRDRSHLGDQEAFDIAVEFFQRLGEKALKAGVVICLEPNPTCYGANFMTTTDETAQVVSAVSHNSIKLQLDTGAVVINNESINHIVDSYSSIIGHIHISEPDLYPVGDCDTDHEKLHDIIAKQLPEHVATIEMIATSNEPHIDSISRAIQFANHCYNSSNRLSE